MEPELVVIGAGPAGVAAVLMAAGLDLRTVLVEAGRVGGKTWDIGALENVPGGWSDGAALARALAADVERVRETGRCILLQARALRVRAHRDRAETVLADGRTLTAGAVLVTTGATALTPGHAPWIEAPEELRPPPLWRARPEDVGAGDPAVVLGADRPLGTWLRTRPETAARLEVLHPAGDAYKTTEVAADARVRLYEVEHACVVPLDGGYRITARCTDGRVHEVRTRVLFGNLGSRAAPPDGDLAPGPDGYCPPAAQHPRLLVAGDLRSARHQRIVTAQGSGAEAVLTHYYATRGRAG
ncbi:FAD-dependent oxidoreductase [Streptomyces sp. NPDC007063]|uniref:FAD-dependent oxidoreductase n=1 Tax=Streptomyces sp. NPDC007063 TaxID=3364772 RepID=UPI0036810257